MNKLLPAAFLAVLIGMTGTVSAQGEQLQQAQIFENEDSRLNSVYVTDQQGNFFGFIFSEDQAQYFGTVSSFDELQGDNLQVCQHYLIPQQRLLRQDRTISELKCSPLQRGMLQQEAPPTNQSQNQTLLQQQPQENQTLLQQTDQNQSQNQAKEGDRYPDLFYAYDADGRYITYVVNNQGDVSNVAGSVRDISQLNQDSMIGCEYYFKLENIGQVQSPSEISCYGYEQLLNRTNQGQMPYLELEEGGNQTTG